MPQPVADAVPLSLGFAPDPTEPGSFTFTGPEQYGPQRARAAVRARCARWATALRPMPTSTYPVPPAPP
ncbi:hypothetical protein ACFV6F_30660 [Kitasatospora phosalacinea]|uniref:hypothetical protein n=1 Tax=Kitasatospora phosalacinea TaxID=2065 RepID=UPI003653B4F1